MSESSALQAQLEFYFSDANLRRSDFLRQEMAKDASGQGCTPSHSILSNYFRKYRPEMLLSA